ncbi:MAG: nicotinate-nucleotide adenylyltransferase [Muribaculaceae bacterium]|nr:nicotinate-nucleotide adenylyltransferase [Muribaculaceae bacterium]
MREIGILGGSFNPVHIGHLMVASYVRQVAGLDEVWLSLSPENPLKDCRVNASDADRMAMLRLAVELGHRLTATDIELSLPRPSYTIDFLRHLAAHFPDCHFRMIIGSDNWLIFDKWKDYQSILDVFGIIVYPRPGYPVDEISHPGARLVKSPGIDISSTLIRQSIRDGLDMNFFLPRGVYSYIMTNKLYS